MGDIVLGSPTTAGLRADVAGRKQLMLRGKKEGRTTLNVWDQKKVLRHEITLLVTTRDALTREADLRNLLAGVSQRGDFQAGRRDAAHGHRRDPGRTHVRSTTSRVSRRCSRRCASPLRRARRPRPTGPVTTTGGTTTTGPTTTPGGTPWRARAETPATQRRRVRTRAVRGQLAVQDRRVRPRRRALGPQPVQGQGHGADRR